MNRVLSNRRLYADSSSKANKPKGFGAGFGLKENASGHAGQASLSLGIIFLITCTLFLGGFYLYQVNKVATQGFEMKEAQDQINDLGKESKKLQIQEVELKSMYNIEKATENSNLINSDTVSYVEMDGPVAMK